MMMTVRTNSIAIEEKLCENNTEKKSNRDTQITSD